MNAENIKLSVSFVTSESTYEEHSSSYPSVIEALEEADDIAFETVGFPLEHWTHVDFGDENKLFLFYPNEDDKTSRYKLTVMSENLE